MEESLNWFNKGVTLFENGDYRGAIAAFDRAIAINPSMCEAWNNRGLSFIQLKEYEGALLSFNKALSLNPEHENAKKGKKIVLEHLEKQKKTSLSQQNDPSKPLSPSDIPRFLGVTVVVWGVVTFSFFHTLFLLFTEPSGQLAFGATFIIYIIFNYIICWIFTKLYPKSKYWRFITWILVLLIVHIAISIAFPIHPSPSPSYQQIYPVIVSSEWNQYTVPQTHMNIYAPQDWNAGTKEMSFNGQKLTSLILSSPDMTTLVSVTKIDETGIPSAPEYQEKELNQGYIDSAQYQNRINALTSSSNDPPATNIIQDSTYYSMHGYPARRVDYDVGNFHVEEFFFIPDKNTLVEDLLMTTTQSTVNERENGLTSMNSINQSRMQPQKS